MMFAFNEIIIVMQNNNHLLKVNSAEELQCINNCQGQSNSFKFIAFSYNFGIKQMLRFMLCDFGIYLRSKK